MDLAPPAAMIERDTPCIACGYNLRGLSAEGRCPECGSTISDSTRGDLLRFADPQWLDRICFGATLKLWNILFTIVLSVVAGVVTALGGPEIILFLIIIVAGLIGLWATFAITSQEPRTALSEDPVTLRKIIRTLALCGLVGEQAQNAAEISGPVAMLWIIVGAVGSLAGVGVSFGELIYFRRFALRIPDPQLVRSTRILMWAVPICGLLLVVGAIIAEYAMIPRMTPKFAAPGAPAGAAASPGAALIPVGICVFGALCFIFFLWYVVLLIRYRRAFKRAAEESRTGRAAPVL